MERKARCIRCEEYKPLKEFGSVKHTIKLMCIDCEIELSRQGFFSSAKLYKEKMGTFNETFGVAQPREEKPNTRLITNNKNIKEVEK